MTELIFHVDRDTQCSP